MKGTIWLLDPKNIVLDTRIIILRAFSSKVMAQNVFSPNGGEHNAPIFGQQTDC